MDVDDKMLDLLELMHDQKAILERQACSDFVTANSDKANWVVKLVTERICTECNNLAFETREQADTHALTAHQAEIIQDGAGGENSCFDITNNEAVPKPDSTMHSPIELVLRKTALAGAVTSYRGNLNDQYFASSLGVFKAAEASIRKHLTELLKLHRGLKVGFTLKVNFIKPTNMDGVISKWLTTHQIILLHNTHIETLINLAVLKIEKQIETFNENGSGLAVASITELDMTTCKFQPTRMGTYQPIPPKLQGKSKLFTNVNNSVPALRKDPDADIENEKKMCFVWSVLAALHPIKHTTRKCDVKRYRKRLGELCLDGLEFPMTLEQIPKFERQNPTLGISVFLYDPQRDEDKDEMVELVREAKRTHDGISVAPARDRENLEKYVKAYMRTPENIDEPVMEQELQEAEDQKATKHVGNSVYPVYVTSARSEQCDAKCVGKCPKHQYLSRCNANCIKQCAIHRKITFIDLLALEVPHDEIRDITDSHFVTIKNLSGLLSNKNKSNQYKIHYCRYCLQSFKTITNLDRHTEVCMIHGPQRTKFSNDWKLEFNDFSGMNHAPYVIYADFEAYLKPAEREDVVTYRKVGNKWQYIFKKSNVSGTTEFKHEHQMCGYAYAVVDNDGLMHEHKVYHAADDDEDVVVKFMNEIIDIGQNLLEEINEKQKEAANVRLGFNTNSNMCYFCDTIIPETVDDIPAKMMDEWYAKVYLTQKGSNFGQKPRADRFPMVFDQLMRVEHHDHFSHEILGNAHNYCNRKCHATRSVTVVIHNLSNYDGHPILQSLGNINQTEDPTFIPLSTERFVSLNLPQEKLGNIRFIDSCRFLPCALSSLTDQLAKEGPAKFPITKTMCDEWTKGAEKDIELLLRKGVFPYNFLSSYKAFQAESLPEKDWFTSDLTKKAISNEDYKHAETVWTAFGCQDFGDYHDLYCLLDVCLLADIMQNFRSLFEDSFGLDPINYVSLPSVSWQAALKYTKVKLDFLKDPDMYLFYEQGLIGGLACGGSVKYAKANNEYVDGYKPEEPPVYIQYLDATNLYGTCLSLPLPTGDFKWSNRYWDHNAILGLKFDGEIGYTFEVDLDVPEHLMQYFDDYPLAPVNRSVDVTELSTLQRELMEKMGMKAEALKTKKLIADLHPKSNYVLDFRTLQLYLNLGMVLTKVHRVLSFRQKIWLKPYIDWCTQKRQEAKNDFEKDFFKLQINWYV